MKTWGQFSHILNQRPNKGISFLCKIATEKYVFLDVYELQEASLNYMGKFWNNIFSVVDNKRDWKEMQEVDPKEHCWKLGNQFKNDLNLSQLLALLNKLSEYTEH